MAKSGNQKMKLLCLREILLRKTDELHPLSAEQLVEQLAATRGIAVEHVGSGDAFLKDVHSSSTPIFLVSDEHGVVPAREVDEDQSDDANLVRFLRDGVAKLFS